MDLENIRQSWYRIVMPTTQLLPGKRLPTLEYSLLKRCAKEMTHLNTGWGPARKLRDLKLIHKNEHGLYVATQAGRSVLGM